MQDDILTETRDNGVATITLNRPEKINSFVPETWRRLTDLFRQYDVDQRVRVIVLTGAGGNFSSGANLNTGGQSPAERSIDVVRQSWSEGLTLIKTMTSMSTPVIAMVEGWAVAGGFSLAMACDLVYAAESAILWPNYLTLGFPPELGTLLFVPSMVGPYKAKEIFLTGRKISAAKALSLGLVCDVFPDDLLREEVYAVADDIAGCAIAAVSMTKRFINATVFDHMDLMLAAEMQNTPFVTMSDESNRLRSSNFLKTAKRS
jgi:2-(1,2-epoxy-1,2-dihydrophenyl)acetyl-CoA isomerase